MLAQFQYAGSHAGQGRGILAMCECLGDPLRDLLHLGFFHAAGGQGRSAEANARRVEWLPRVERNHVLIHSDPSDIERVFGTTGEPLPRTGPGASHVFAYNVSVSGAPSKISVYASFAEKPKPETGAKGVMFRIDPP